MGTYHQQCRQFLILSLGMFACGMALPIALGLLAPGVLVSPAVWNFLQMGGLIGAATFAVLGRIGRPARSAGVPEAHS